MQQKIINRSDYTPPHFSIDKIDLVFNLDVNHTQVTNCMQVTRLEQNKPLLLDGENLKLLSIKLNNQNLAKDEYQLTKHHLIIPNPPASFCLSITTEISPINNTALEGLFISNNIFCTQCEAHGFRHMTYYLDRPDVMSTFTTKIIANKKDYPQLLSNGNLLESGHLDDDKHFALWHDPFKKPCYLFALVAGDLDVLDDNFTTMNKRKINLKIFVEKGFKDRAYHAMDSLKQAVRWDEEKFGREYDLDIFMIVAVSDFNMGAMENKGLNIFNSKYILADANSATDIDFEGIQIVVGHEYFHNWTGNRITCRDWFQLSLKEGLTVFRDQEFDADLNSRAITRINDVKRLRLSQFPEDASPLAHPVRPESYIAVDNFYTATVYEKGAEVIRMLQTILTPAGFRQGMDLYFDRHDGQAVTCDDFIQAMSDANNVDLTQFKLWYSQVGTPTVKVKTYYDQKHRQFQIELSQSCPVTLDKKTKEPFTIPIKMALLTKNSQQANLFLLNKKQDSIIFENIDSKPILSIGRNFSAPIHLEYKRTIDDLYFLAENDDDAFNRWEACQDIMLDIITSAIAKNTIPTVEPRLYKLLNNIAHDSKLDKALIAYLLALPSPIKIAQQFKIDIPVDKIITAHQHLRQSISHNLYDCFTALYDANHISVDYVFNADQAARRSLQNQCLYYLMHANTVNGVKLAVEQYHTANNMTNKLAALSIIANIDVPEQKTLLDDFYNQWQHDSLVIDKWLMIQTGSELSSSLDTTKRLISHPQFSYQKPNKVRAVIGNFANNNFGNFHTANGDGYQFLADQIILVDKINPQVAARLVIPLTEWQAHQLTRQKLMREALELVLSKENLSDNVYELVKKAIV